MLFRSSHTRRRRARFATQPTTRPTVLLASHRRARLVCVLARAPSSAQPINRRILPSAQVVLRSRAGSCQEGVHSCMHKTAHAGDRLQSRNSAAGWGFISLLYYTCLCKPLYCTHVLVLGFVFKCIVFFCVETLILERALGFMS